MNYIIFDLEATCEKDNKNFPNEIIEIGAVKINDKKEILGVFNIFVKPKINPQLTGFCKELTSITQQDVDNAQLFAIAIKEFKEWIGNEPFVLCSWGFYDKKQIEKDSVRHGLSHSWANNHISLKHQFGTIKGVRPCGMGKALRMLNLPLDGTHHRGIDDAKNIGKIFISCFDKWNID